MKINKVLIANRGEIALRIMRSLKQKGIRSVAVYATDDRESLHVKMADEAWPLKGETLRETYLNSNQIIQIAQQCKAEAIHPGYGFLSENPVFAEACRDNKLIFIGPSAENIRLMGDKVKARETARRFGLPVTNGLTGNTEQLMAESHKLRFPVLVKAAAGGGGKGMRIVHQADELAQVLEATQREAEKYFGNGSVYLEEFIESPRHIEVQVLADAHGNVIHLYERECSVQRRYQKIIEESPSPTLNPEIREKMGQAAVNLCKGIAYQSAGTIEFLYSPDGNFYFLEMNTRIQVEHPVTELVTDIDLVGQQLDIAKGQTLSLKQSDIIQKGHAIECRIYAEDPLNDFVPSPGEINFYREPNSQNIRIDSAYNAAGHVSPAYDPMISKLIGYGANRSEAIGLLLASLPEYVVHGIKTNIPYLSALLALQDYQRNHISTAFCETHAAEITEAIQAERKQIPEKILISAFLLQNPGTLSAVKDQNIWHSIGYWRNDMRFGLSCDGAEYEINILERSNDGICFVLNNEKLTARYLSYQRGLLSFTLNGIPSSIFISFTDTATAIVQSGIQQYTLKRLDQLEPDAGQNFAGESSEKGNLFAPMPGKVIKVNVEVDAIVERGSLLIVVEAMKMENNLVAPHKARVASIQVKEGDMVNTKTQLIHLEEIE